MIRYFSKDTQQYTMGVFLAEWAPGFASEVRVGAYDGSIFADEVFQGAKEEVWIFSDLERLNTYQLNCLKIIAEQIESFNPDFLILNDPRYWKGRKLLLKELFQAGRNNFNVWDFFSNPNQFRFPVFIRYHNEHAGNLTALLENEDHFKKALIEVLIRGHDPEQLIVVEYEDMPTSEGYYKKYSSFCFYDRIVPAHIVYSENWVAKVGSPQTETQMEEVDDYLSNNPHEKELKEIFSLSGVSYGRIDYSIKDGRIQTWEINTNPQLMQARSKYQKNMIPIKEKVTEKYVAELSRISELKAPKGVPRGYKFELNKLKEFD